MVNYHDTLCPVFAHKVHLRHEPGIPLTPVVRSNAQDTSTPNEISKHSLLPERKALRDGSVQYERITHTTDRQRYTGAERCERQHPYLCGVKFTKAKRIHFQN